MIQHVAPIGAVQNGFHQIANGDHAHQRGDHRFQRPESVAFKPEDDDRHEGRQQAGQPERNSEQQVEPDRRADELRQVGRHRDDFHQHPQPDHDRPGKMLAAQLGQVLPGGDSEFGGEGLDDDRHQVAGHHDPQQRVSELRASLQVRGEVARVHVRHAGDEGGAEKRQQPAQDVLPAAARKDIRRTLARVDIGGSVVGHM